VLVETPTYLGALQAFSLFEPNFVSVTSDEDGLVPSALTPKTAGRRALPVRAAELPESDRTPHAAGAARGAGADREAANLLVSKTIRMPRSRTRAMRCRRCCR
jgi:hypothetical protein